MPDWKKIANAGEDADFITDFVLRKRNDYPTENVQAGALVGIMAELHVIRLLLQAQAALDDGK